MSEKQSPGSSQPVSVTLPSRIPHRIAVLLACIVFPLIWVGGLVTTYDAGMAVPDWPGTYGYNMFLYPLETWLWGPFDLLVEHGHRLLGSLSGLISIALVVASFRWEPRRWVRWFSVALLVLIILQGSLGGIRVLIDARDVAKIHGCLGPAFFAAVIAFCVVTSRWWWRVLERSPGEQPIGAGRGLSRLATVMLIISFLQLVLGAFIRHIGVDASPAAYKHLVLTHITTAIFLVGGTLLQWSLSRRSAFRGSGVRGSINWLALLILTQFCLGLGTWIVKYGWPAMLDDRGFAASYIVGEKSFFQMNLVTAHQAVGSLILCFWTIHALRCWRFALRNTCSAPGNEMTAPGNSNPMTELNEVPVST